MFVGTRVIIQRFNLYLELKNNTPERISRMRYVTFNTARTTQQKISQNYKFSLIVNYFKLGLVIIFYSSPPSLRALLLT